MCLSSLPHLYFERSIFILKCSGTPVETYSMLLLCYIHILIVTYATYLGWVFHYNMIESFGAYLGQQLVFCSMVIFDTVP